jgi:alanyl-tRNA synthetase
VSDVLIDDDGVVVHIVDRDITATQVHAKIDGARRLASMQHHSGQHLLSQAIDETLKLDTVSANINIDTPSTIDLETPVDIDVTSAENLANQIIYRDLAIKSYFVDETQVHTVPLRRPPKVAGQIRIIEIDGFDYSACGGTHCARTGMIGIVKILRIERRAERLRIHFVCGQRALKYFQNYHSIVTAVARQFDTGIESIVDAIQKQRESVGAMQKELAGLREIKLMMESRQLAAQAEAFESIKLVTASFRHRPPQELRALASQLQNEANVVALLASYDGNKLSLAVACAPDTRVSANELIRKQLAEIGRSARGGGDAGLAQGGGAASEQQYAALFAKTKEYIRFIHSS